MAKGAPGTQNWSRKQLELPWGGYTRWVLPDCTPPPRHHSSPDVVRGLEGLKRVGGGAQMWPWRGERPDFGGGGGCRPDVAGG